MPTPLTHNGKPVSIDEAISLIKQAWFWDAGVSAISDDIVKIDDGAYKYAMRAQDVLDDIVIHGDDELDAMDPYERDRLRADTYSIWCQYASGWEIDPLDLIEDGVCTIHDAEGMAGVAEDIDTSLNLDADDDLVADMDTLTVTDREIGNGAIWTWEPNGHARSVLMAVHDLDDRKTLLLGLASNHDNLGTWCSKPVSED